MSKLANLFLQLRDDKGAFLGASTGEQFEERIKVALNKLGYDRILKESIADHRPAIRKRRDEKWAAERLQNCTGFRRHFLHQPDGSQEFSDFVVLDGDQVYFVEVKFKQASSGKPMWNSGLPRPTGIYILASLGRRDITFFMGKNVVHPDEARACHAFFAKLKDAEAEFNRGKMSRQRYGFAAYIRKALDQTKSQNREAVLDFFRDDRRGEHQDAVIQYVS